jgi:hypothetical protein
MPTLFTLDFEPNQSQTVQVSVTVPRSTAAKKGAFRLRVAKDSESDDDSIDSRPVAFEVAALPAAPPPKTSFPWWAVAAAVVVLLVGAGGLWFVLNMGPSIDQIRAKVVGEPIEEAENILSAENLSAVRRVVSGGDTDPGRVIAADFDTNDRRKVHLSYDPGVVVPDLTDQSMSRLVSVFRELSGKAFPVIRSTSDDASACSDMIGSQDPLEPSGTYKTGTTFFFTVRKGTKPNCVRVFPRFEEFVRLNPDLLIQQ